MSKSFFFTTAWATVKLWQIFISWGCDFFSCSNQKETFHLNTQQCYHNRFSHKGKVKASFLSYLYEWMFFTLCYWSVGVNACSGCDLFKGTKMILCGTMIGRKKKKHLKSPLYSSHAEPHSHTHTHYTVASNNNNNSAHSRPDLTP